nr:hypothetical protein [Nanoarchaeota archaeon]
MPLFNKPTDLPVDQVKAMRAKGFDNNQIVQALQRNGYSSTQIFDALNQANLVSGAGAPVDPPLSPGGSVGMGQEPAEDYGDAGIGMGGTNEEIEELVESIIEEKWEALVKDINKILEWKNAVDMKITKLEQRFESLQEEFDKLHQAIIGKIGEYDKNILAVGADIKAMEKVFSKVLPVFTENVNELSRITQAVKKKA